jgi:hypothetical protein
LAAPTAGPRCRRRCPRRGACRRACSKTITCICMVATLRTLENLVATCRRCHLIYAW